jgi:hypothetical protein
MITWTDSKEFTLSIDAVRFDKSLRTVSGEVRKLSKSIFDIVHESVDEGQYLFEAWRWCGTYLGNPFYLDIASNDARRARPLSFHICSEFTNFDGWEIVKFVKPIFDGIGEVRVIHVGSKVANTEFELIRDNNYDHRAEVVFRGNLQKDIEACAEYLRTNFSDQNLFVARRVVSLKTVE